MPSPPEIIDFIDNNADRFIQRLAEAVAIPRCALNSTIYSESESNFRLA
jgi:hypothetical protein